MPDIKRIILSLFSIGIFFTGCTKPFSENEALLITERFLEAKPVIYKVVTTVDESSRTISVVITINELLSIERIRSISEQYLHVFSSHAGGKSGNGNHYGEIWDYYSFKISFQTLCEEAFHEGKKTAGATKIVWSPMK